MKLSRFQILGFVPVVVDLRGWRSVPGYSESSRWELPIAIEGFDHRFKPPYKAAYELTAFGLGFCVSNSHPTR